MNMAQEHSIVAPQNETIDSKEIVLDAAQRLINHYGYTGFSMRDLAQESGLAKATLYHHFADKHAIFIQVLERDLKAASDCITHAAATPGDLPTRLRNVAGAFFTLATERGVLLLSTLRQAARMEGELCELVRRYRDQTQGPIVDLFEEAIAEGSIRPVDPDFATMSFLGLLQVFASRRILLNDIELDESAVNFILDFTLSGLSPHPPSDHASC
jgi:AcrR family transcriptional regulator